MEWKEITLGEIAIFKTGKLNSNAAISNGEYPFFTCSPETLRINNYAFDQEAILLAGNNADGNFSIKYYKGKFNAYQRTYVITPIRGKVDIKFLYYALSLCLKQFKNMSQGTSTKFLTVTILNSFSVQLPSISDQHRIASILSSLDRKIELNNKINADLEEMAQAIFKNWFVDFEPFKDGKFVDSELGKIPEGWKVGRLTDVIKLMPGGTPKTSEPLYWDNGTIPFFSPKDVNGVYCFATEKHITETGLNKCSSNLYPKDTIFITCRGTVGKVCLAACDMAMNQSNYAIKAIDGYSQYYIFFLVKSVVERLIKKSNGAVFSAITSKDFDEEILIPSQKAVEDFTNVIDGFFRRIFTIGTENSRLSLLRDTLLPRLMSGELEVPE